MPIFFDRPVGASADVNELEYISALHQTDKAGVRTDGTISDSDISLFLCSRFGIIVSEEEVRNTIIQGLGGGNSDGGSIDLMEIVAILMIPTILKASEETKKEGVLHEKVLKPVPDLLQTVLNTILEDVTGDSQPKQLDKDLLKRIFKAYGESDLAEDDELHEEMIHAVRLGEAECEELNLSAFAAALSYDIREYDLKNEYRSTTVFDDVMLTQGGRDFQKGQEIDQSRELSLDDVESRKSRATGLVKIFTAPAIDSTAGTYRSKYLMTFLWLTVIITYFVYWFNMSLIADQVPCPEYTNDFNTPWSVNSASMACETGVSILNWVATFLVFSLFGLVFIGLGSIGNGVSSRRYCGPLFGMFLVFLLVYCPYKINEDPRGEGYLDVASLILGFVVCFFHLCNFLVLFLKPQTLRRYPVLKKVVRSGLLTDLRDLKRAGQVKMNHMTKNALAVQGESERGGVLGTNFGRGLHNFAIKGDAIEESGGFKWTWSRICDNSVFAEEGLWFSDRLISSNMAQFIISLYVLIAGIALTSNAVENYDAEEAKKTLASITGRVLDQAVDEAILDKLLMNFTGLLGTFVNGEAIDCSESLTNDAFDSLCDFEVGTNDISCESNATVDYLCAFADFEGDGNGDEALSKQLALLQASGFDASEFTNVLRIALDEAAKTSIDSLYPSADYMIFWPLAIGTVAAFLTAVYLSVTFLPSITSTILQLRSGVIPTLHNKDFNKYRAATDQVSILTGSMFWGCFISSALVGGFVGLIVFVFLWQATVYFVQKMLAVAIGLLTVAILRICLLTACRGVMYSAFYRKRPLSANLSLLALEWANFPLAVGFVFLRVIKLIIAAAIFIGRIDTPFLAPRVGRFKNFELDNYPTVFLKDILTHEAHKHPYIELLGSMYLMKLRYRDHFGKRAGSCWRLLFVYALMPWMHKYRIQVHDEPEILFEAAVVDEPERAATRPVAFLGHIRLGLRRRKQGREEDESPIESETFRDLTEGATVSERDTDEYRSASLLRARSVKLEKENEDLREQLSLLYPSLLMQAPSTPEEAIHSESNEYPQGEPDEEGVQTMFECSPETTKVKGGKREVRGESGPNTSEETNNS